MFDCARLYNYVVKTYMYKGGLRSLYWIEFVISSSKMPFGFSLILSHDITIWKLFNQCSPLKRVQKRFLKHFTEGPPWGSLGIPKLGSCYIWVKILNSFYWKDMCVNKWRKAQNVFHLSFSVFINGGRGPIRSAIAKFPSIGVMGLIRLSTVIIVFCVLPPLIFVVIQSSEFRADIVCRLRWLSCGRMGLAEVRPTIYTIWTRKSDFMPANESGRHGHLHCLVGLHNTGVFLWFVKCFWRSRVRAM